MMKFVDGVQAQGGGDIPEAVHDGLWASIANMTWRENDEKKSSQNDLPYYGCSSTWQGVHI